MRTKRRTLTEKRSPMTSKKLVSQDRMAKARAVKVQMERSNRAEIAATRSRQTKRQERRRGRRSCEPRLSW